MKKLLSMMLCLVLVCGMLISCDEDKVFGSYLPNYNDYEPEETETLALNLYIITEEDSSEIAKETVKLNVNIHTVKYYDTELKLHYLTASQYQSKVIEEVNASDEDSAHIVLINSAAMMTNLMSADKLVDLTPYLATDEYGRLNAEIPEALLSASMINERYYAIPNNHVLGEYEYLVINEWANDEFNVIPPSMFDNDLGPADLEGLDALVAELETKLENAGYDPDQYIYTRKGPYEMQAKIEAEDENLQCIAIKNPTVDETVAFSSAFAIVDRGEKFNERAMKIVYAMNMDVELRNLIQYGVKDINYKLDSETNTVTRYKDETNRYSMNLFYTGDLFKAYYCPEIGWTAEVSANGKLQNKESVLAD